MPGAEDCWHRHKRCVHRGVIGIDGDMKGLLCLPNRAAKGDEQMMVIGISDGKAVRQQKLAQHIVARLTRCEGKGELCGTQKSTVD